MDNLNTRVLIVDDQAEIHSDFQVLVVAHHRCEGADYFVGSPFSGGVGGGSLKGSPLASAAIRRAFHSCHC